jgi:hypothetical protein
VDRKVRRLAVKISADAAMKLDLEKEIAAMNNADTD